MKHLSKKTRLILGLAILLLCVILSWLLIDVLGDMAMVIPFLGAFAFVFLNPELMRGE